MAKNKDKTVWAVIGVLLTLFGIIGTIPLALNKGYFLGIPITAISVVIGVILIAWAFKE